MAEGSAGSRNYTKCGKRSGSAVEHEVGISFDGRTRSSIKLLQNQQYSHLLLVNFFFHSPDYTAKKALPHFWAQRIRLSQIIT